MSRPLKDPKAHAEKLVNAVLKSLYKLQRMAFNGDLSEDEAGKVVEAIQVEIKEIEKKIKLRKSLPNEDEEFKL